MVDLAGVTIGGGYDVLAVDGEGRIRLDHQYIGIDATRDSAA
ncbi:hypothetical protein ACTD5D_18815 [Nocardia takedensis]|nr:hypothetical protein [Nocardia takedensis]